MHTGATALFTLSALLGDARCQVSSHYKQVSLVIALVRAQRRQRATRRRLWLGSWRVRIRRVVGIILVAVGR